MAIKGMRGGKRKNTFALYWREEKEKEGLEDDGETDGIRMGKRKNTFALFWREVRERVG